MTIFATFELDVVTLKQKIIDNEKAKINICEKFINLIIRKMKKISLLLILSSLYLTVLSQTTIEDSSLVSGVWQLAESPFILDGRVIIQEGATLTIEPGVEIRLKSSSSTDPSWFDFSTGNVGVIRVQGEIIANGTSANPILFTRNNTGYWGTILIDETASSNSSFSNCVIEYAKESRNITGITSPVVFDGGVSIYKNAINFENNELRNNRMTGLYISQANTLFEFSNNTFHSNGSSGVAIAGSIVNGINNTLYNNSIVSTGYVAAIRCFASTVYLVGNLIYSNDDCGIYTTGTGNVNIVNNTIIGNYQGIKVEDNANTFITNTIVQSNTTNFATAGTIGDAIIEMQYSLTDDSGIASNVTNLTGNIFNSDAIFVDSNINDFSLQNTSPCIDAGAQNIDNLNIPEFDILQNRRIDNNTIDIGAIEFQHPVENFFITTISNPLAGGSTSGNGSYTNGAIVTVNAIPETGYEFVNWTENGNQVSTNAIYEFTATTNRDLVANFNVETSIVNKFESNSVTVYPNPTKGQFTLGFNNEHFGVIDINIYSTIGKLIKKLKINKAFDKHTYEVDLENIPRGSYIINIISSTENISKSIVIY